MDYYQMRVYKHSLTARNKISLSKLGKILPDSTKYKISAFNRTRSQRPGTLLKIHDTKTNITIVFLSMRTSAKGIQCDYSTILKYQVKYFYNIDNIIFLYK